MRKLKMQGGLRVRWEGWPSSEIEPLLPLENLTLRLRDGRFHFRDLLVADGDRVHAGQVLATDPDAYGVPLLAPLGANIALQAGEKGPEAIRLDALDPREVERDEHPTPPSHVNPDTLSAGKRAALIQGGGWHLIRTFPNDILPPAVPGPIDTRPDMGVADPNAQPAGIVVSCLKTESFGSRGRVLLQGNLREFALGLESLQEALGGYEPIYLVVPEEATGLAQRIQDQCRGYAWLQIRTLPVVYPYDHPGPILQALGERPDPKRPFWYLTTEGALAAHRILVSGRPQLSRVITIAGPGVQHPTHLRTYAGASVQDLLANRLIESDEELRVIKGGGIFTGSEVDPATATLGIGDDALTVVPAGRYRELLGFMRPGLTRHSTTRAFASSAFPLLPKKMTTRLEGERRPCIQCNSCEDVCPIRDLMPYLYHHYVGQEMIDELEQAGIWQCIECGCCSYVCPSKIPLLTEIREGKRMILEDMAEMEED